MYVSLSQTIETKEEKKKTKILKNKSAMNFANK